MRDSLKCGTRCNFAFRKCTNHQNPALRVFNGRKCTKNGAIYPQKRYTFTNKVGQYAISIPLIGSQSRHSHPIKSAFYAILLRFSWDIGIYSATTPLTANQKRKSTTSSLDGAFSLLICPTRRRRWGMSERSDEIPVRDELDLFYWHKCC